MNFTKNLQKTLILYKSCREYGLSTKDTILILIYKIFNHVFYMAGVPHKLETMQFTNLKQFQQKEELDVIGHTKRLIPEKYLKNDKKIFTWVLPYCSNIWGGGHYTIFRFIEYFSREHNIDSIIWVYDNNNAKMLSGLEETLNSAFNTDAFFVMGHEGIETDAIIATTWQSAYYVRESKISPKFYLMQDYESLFYPFGALSLQANYTYEFGFYGITGGHWLKKTFESYKSSIAHAYIFSADRDIFYPSDPNNLVSEKVKRIFFYGRPSTPRRAFELGIGALELISDKYPDIEIVIAGLDNISKPKFNCTLLGNLSLRETGDLYRSCDIGLALSATNMSYLPVELMASGCPVVSNKGENVEWYCKHNYNALLASPTATALFSAVESLINSKELRLKLVQNGLETANATTWQNEMDKIHEYILSRLPQTKK
jgi:glycosyltransferase involved in cell wall biosynthesis